MDDILTVFQASKYCSVSPKTIINWIEQIDTEKMFYSALEAKVAFVPGHVFYPNGGGHNTMRLNFSCMGPDSIRVGIDRLGRALNRELT